MEIQSCILDAVQTALSFILVALNGMLVIKFPNMDLKQIYFVFVDDKCLYTMRLFMLNITMAAVFRMVDSRIYVYPGHQIQKLFWSHLGCTWHPKPDQNDHKMCGHSS